MSHNESDEAEPTRVEQTSVPHPLSFTAAALGTISKESSSSLTSPPTDNEQFTITSSPAVILEGDALKDRDLSPVYEDSSRYLSRRSSRIGDYYSHQWKDQITLIDTSKVDLAFEGWSTVKCET